MGWVVSVVVYTAGCALAGLAELACSYSQPHGLDSSHVQLRVPRGNVLEVLVPFIVGPGVALLPPHLGSKISGMNAVLQAPHR